MNFKRNEISEKQIQRMFFEWLSYYPDVRRVTFAIPNGGSRHKLEGLNLKKEGVTPGVPDIFMAIPNEKHHGLFIELKSHSGKLSLNQKNMIRRLEENRYLCKTCYNFDDAKNVLMNYLQKDATHD